MNTVRYAVASCCGATFRVRRNRSPQASSSSMWVVTGRPGDLGAMTLLRSVAASSSAMNIVRFHKLSLFHWQGKWGRFWPHEDVYV